MATPQARLLSPDPVFELDYPSAEAEWTSGETETIDVSDATDVNKTVFTSFKGTDTTPHLDWDGAKTLVGKDGVLSFNEFTKDAAVAPATSVEISTPTTLPASMTSTSSDCAEQRYRYHWPDHWQRASCD